jgi:hypothetical protein
MKRSAVTWAPFFFVVTLTLLSDLIVEKSKIKDALKNHWLKWLTGVLFVLFVGSWWIAQRVDFRTSDDDLVSQYTQDNQNLPLSIHRYQVENRTVRYVEFGHHSLPVTILVHGAPSSLSFFSSLYADTSLTNHTLLVGVDRPGYGYSDFGASVTSVRKQAHFLQPLIDYIYPKRQKGNTSRIFLRRIGSSKASDG